MHALTPTVICLMSTTFCSMQSTRKVLIDLLTAILLTVQNFISAALQKQLYIV